MDLSPQNRPLIEVTRGEHVESRHDGTVAVVDQSGTLLAYWGDVTRAAYMRSSAKPFQALPLVESGVVDAFAIRPEELAVICASHVGRERHLKVLHALLNRLELDEELLQCGLHSPLDKRAALRLKQTGEKPSVLHNNCSGKHMGMLAACSYHGYPLENYLSFDHPWQQRILETLAQLADLPTASIGLGVDGCSAPNFSMPIAAMALAFARLAASSGGDETRRQALSDIFAAMTQHPTLVSGPGELDALLMQCGRGELVAKSGAEGVLTIGLRGFKADGIGIAIKVWDGDKSGRARTAAALGVLDQLGWLTEDQRRQIEEVISPAVITRTGKKVGLVRAAFELESSDG